MTARVLTGSKAQIAQQVANIEGDVRQVIVLIDEPLTANADAPVPATVEEMFGQMDKCMAHGAGHVDDSRAGTYTRQEGE